MEREQNMENIVFYLVRRLPCCGKESGCTVTAFAPIPRCYSLIPEAEFMSVQLSLRFLGIILRVLKLEVSV
jgi:hypothetical protein